MIGDRGCVSASDIANLLIETSVILEIEEICEIGVTESRLLLEPIVRWFKGRIPS